MTSWKILTTTLAACLLASGPSFAHDGTLPLGDGHLSNAPQSGSVYACRTDFRRAGTVKNEPWIEGGRWHPAEKPVVEGEVHWPNAAVSIALEDGMRVVRANGLPDHPTGEFPIARDSLAFRYDRNPNRIAAQEVLLRLPALPQTARAPSCLPMGMIGFALTGVAIYNALDAAGLDAAAHEVQDKCSGHPQQAGEYHYHSLSPCMADPDGAAGRPSALVGYALDGFGIYGPVGEDGKRLTNADLDACHGHVGTVMWDGAPRAIYHYHLTDEYPYTLGCFVGTSVGGHVSRGPAPGGGQGMRERGMRPPPR